MEGILDLSYRINSVWKIQYGILGLKQGEKIMWKDFLNMYHCWVTPFPNNQILEENLGNQLIRSGQSQPDIVIDR